VSVVFSRPWALNVGMTVRWGMLSAAATGRVVAAAIRDLPDAEFVAVAAYRLEFAAASHAIETGEEPLFGRADAVAQAATIGAIREAARAGARVRPGSA